MGWAEKLKRDAAGNGHGLLPEETPEGSAITSTICVCGWMVPGPTGPADAMRQLVQHAAEAHAIAARSIPKFNDEYARRAVALSLQHAKLIESKMRGSPIAGLDGRAPSEIDLQTEMVVFMRDSALALSSVLDLLLAMTTNNPALSAEPPKRQAAASAAP